MLHLFLGTDREKARMMLQKAVSAAATKKKVLRITDANALSDLEVALQGAGMFEQARAVVLEGILSNDDMRERFLTELPKLAHRDDEYFLYEEKIDASTRKAIEKHAETVEKFDAATKVRRGDIFTLAFALSRKDKKALWVGYQEALARDEAPEAIHGVLFWGAKEMCLKGDREKRSRGEKLVAELAELPHEARRSGVELEYALEKYILGLSR